MTITLLIPDGDLCIVVLTPPKTSELEGFFQLGLTPVTHQLFVAFQRAGQVLCLARHGHAHRLEMFDLLAQRCAVAHHIGMHLIDSCLKLINFFCERLQQAIEAFLISGLQRLAGRCEQFLADHL